MQIRQLYLPILSFFLFIPFFLTAQINVSKIDASFNPGNKDGIVYALPRTLIQVDVLVKQKELLAGPLRNYAEKYLGITNYISENAFEYSIEEINLSTVAVVDPDQYYFVSKGEKTSREAWKTDIVLNGHGMITSVSPRINEGPQSGNISNRMSAEEINELFRTYADLNMYAKVDTVVRTINIDTITIEDYTFKTTMTEKPLEVKAKEVAEMIQKIREGRYNLITGYQEVNYSEGALKFMNAELQELELEYLRLFTGAAVNSYLTYTFTFLPTAENSGSAVPLFRLSRNSGISNGGGGGEQLSILVEPSGNTASVTSDITGKGLRYRIPEEALVKVQYRGNVAAQIRTVIAQFGRVAALSADASNVEFDGETGGLKSVKLQSE